MKSAVVLIVIGLGAAYTLYRCLRAWWQWLDKVLGGDDPGDDDADSR
jgi:hypothetical protein